MTNLQKALELLNGRYDLDLDAEYGDLDNIVVTNETLVEWKRSRQSWRSMGTINEMFESYPDSFAWESVQPFKGDRRCDLYGVEIDGQTYTYKY